MNPYERWRQAVWVAGVAVIMLLTLVILLAMVGLLLAWFGAGQTGTPSGY